MNKGPIFSIELTYTNVNNGGDKLVDEMSTLEATLMGLSVLNWGYSKIQRLIEHIKVTFYQVGNGTYYHFKLTLRPIYGGPLCEVWVEWEKAPGTLKYCISEGRAIEQRPHYYDYKGVYCDKDSAIAGIKNIIAKALGSEASRIREIATEFDKAAERSCAARFEVGK